MRIPFVCESIRRIEFEQNVGPAHMVAVLWRQRLHLACQQRLYDLDAAGRLDLALRRSDNVDAAEIGPGQRNRGEQTDDQDQRHAYGRWRRLQNLEGRRQKFVIGTLCRPSRKTQIARGVRGCAHAAPLSFCKAQRRE